MCVTNVGKLLVKMHTFCGIRKFTLERNYIRVKTMTVPQVTVHSLWSSRKPT